MTRKDSVNILMVDDQPAKLLSYEVVLSDLDENLIRANSAKQALEVLLKTDIALVLMDVCMPDVDGFELANMIRQHPRCERTAIILISAIHLTDLDRLRGYQSGAVDYIPVPVIPEILKAKVRVFADLYRNRQQLEKLNQELEQRVAERTADLEAYAAKLQETDRRKDHFLAMLAHELRNPLTPIASAAMALRIKTAPDSDLQWISQVIERQVKHLKRLIDDLLDLNRISRNKLELQRERVELTTVLTAAVEAIRPAIDQRRHEFLFKLPQDPIFVSADPVRLTQVFGNLLDNSAKFTDPGGKISIEVESDAQAVRVRVIDNGIGIPEEELTHISEPFYQLDTTLTKSHGGLGVGLSLVWQLVEMHRGRVEVRSEGPGKGSQFTVHLPRLAATTADLPRSPAHPVPEGAAHESDLRILIAEDNPDSAAALALYLRLEGHTVEIAHDGIQALELAEKFRPHVALLDIGMPKLSGYEVARQIRHLDWSKDTLLVAQTGWGRPEDCRQTEEYGFNVHLTKPLDYDALSALLEASSTQLRKPGNGHGNGNGKGKGQEAVLGIGKVKRQY